MKYYYNTKSTWQVNVMNDVEYELENRRYRKKYRNIKMRIKSLILENAALCDEVAKIQESLAIVKDERKFLLRKLLEYENELEMSQYFYRNDSNFTANGQRARFNKKRNSNEEGGKLVT